MSVQGQAPASLGVVENARVRLPFQPHPGGVKGHRLPEAAREGSPIGAIGAGSRRRAMTN